MTKLSVDQLLSKSKNKFVLANALSKRAKQIIEGSLPYVDDFNPANPIITAMKEIAADRIKIKIGEAQGEKPAVLAAEQPVKRLSLAKEEKKGPKKKKKK